MPPAAPDAGSGFATGRLGEDLQLSDRASFGAIEGPGPGAQAPGDDHPIAAPGVDPPTRLETERDRADFIARLCTAWDFGIVPDAAIFVEVTRPDWRSAVDLGAVLSSASYHFLRRCHGLPALPFLVDVPADIRDDPNLAFV